MQSKYFLYLQESIWESKSLQQKIENYFGLILKNVL